MKKIILSAIIVAVILALPFSTSSLGHQAISKSDLLIGSCISSVKGKQGSSKFDYPDENTMLKNMIMACKNKKYEMYYDQKSLTIGIRNIENGAVFLSNPYNAQFDPYYFGDIAKELKSQLIVHYVGSDNNIHSIYSSSDCAEIGQYTIDLFTNGIKINMSLGKEQNELICPEYFKEEVFKDLLNKMSVSNKEQVLSYYTYVNIKNHHDDSNYTEIIKKYPILKKNPGYILTKLNNNEKKKLDNALHSVGYDRVKYAKDSKKYNFESIGSTNVNVKLSIEYAITDKGLTTRIPRDSIVFDNKSIYLYSIDIMPYFAADTETMDGNGYLFIPDGSGALINLSGQKQTRRRTITSRVYGFDAALNENTYKIEGEQYYLPVFGIKRNNNTAVFSIIENGDDMSEITAKLGEPNSKYYSVYNSFLYTSEEQVTRNAKVASLNSGKKVYIHDDNISDSDLTISYYFLFEDNANYVAMSKIYHNYLLNKGLTQSNPSDEAYFGLESVGLALYDNSFLGFKYKDNALFTKYSDNIKMLNYLTNQGIDKISLRLTGWQKYGLDKGVVNDLKPSKALGGKGQFNRLISWCRDRSIQVYAQADIAFVKNDRIMDGFYKNSDAARQIDRSFAQKSTLNASTQKYENPSLLLSPIKYNNVINKLFKSAGRYNISGLDFSSLGSYLNSDFNSENPQNRYQTMHKIINILESKPDDKNMAFSGANAYILPYTSTIYDLPMTSSNYLGESVAIPFVQLVVSGSIHYQSKPINLSNDIRSELLKCIATGTIPQITMAYQNVELLKLTNHTKYFSIGYNMLKQTIMDNYNYIEKAIKAIRGSKLVDYKVMKNGISVSLYENGTKIYVNYSDSDITNGELLVPAKGYIVQRQ